eukprot:scaffold3258_cov382-Prasinococcus_capsulatus_cf.AAC.5
MGLRAGLLGRPNMWSVAAAQSVWVFARVTLGVPLGAGRSRDQRPGPPEWPRTEANQREAFV